MSLNNVFIHQSSDVQSEDIGQGTKIWQYAVVLKGATLGEDCNVCAHTFIENDVVIGNNVTLKCGVFLWDGIEVGNRVFIGPNATFTNDGFPRSKEYPDDFARTILEDGCSIGANATILPGLVIGENAMVGAGAVVTKNVAPNTIVVGNPAKELRKIP